MIKVNLLPVRAARKKETFMNQIYVGILVIIISLGVVTWRAWTMQSHIKSLEAQVSKRTKELKDLETIQKEVDKFKAMNKILEDKIAVMTSLEEGRDWFIRIVDHISMSIPDNVWITSMSLGAGRSRRGGGGGISSSPISINGEAYEKDAIGYFISNLESNDTYVSSVDLGRITQKKGGKELGGVDIYSYDLTINIKPPPKS
jgi:type IV pilus assembly protein PilN